MNLIRGIISAIFLFTNTLFWCLLLYALVLIKLVMPTKGLRKACSNGMVWLAETWIACNSAALDFIHPIDWRIRGLEGLSRDKSYLVSSNHQSWTDITILQKALNRRIPFLRFFIKKELIYVPLLGLAWKALDYPMMKRYSKEYLEKHPEKRGEDLKTTRIACERLKGSNISVLNFLEGTRITPKKHARQNSPYKNLLKPKTGGLAFVIESMGEQFHSLLDITIFYPQGPVSLWDFMSGKLDVVEIEISEVPIPKEFLGKSYLNDEVYREKMQAWVHELWVRKDNRLEELKSALAKSRDT